MGFFEQNTGLFFLAVAVLAGASGWVGGALRDRFGRRHEVRG